MDSVGKGRKRGVDEVIGEEEDVDDWGRGELVSEGQIENVYKRQRRSKEEKLASVQVCLPSYVFREGGRGGGMCNGSCVFIFQ